MSHDERPLEAEAGVGHAPEAGSQPVPPLGPGYPPPPGRPPNWSPAPTPAPGWMPPPHAWSQSPGSGWPPPAEYGSSTPAVIGGGVLLVFGLLISLISAVVLVIWAGGAELFEAIDPTFPAGAIAGMLIVVSGIMLVIGVLHVIAALGVFVRRSWARWLGLVLAALGLVIGALMLLGLAGEPGTTPGDMVVVLVWLAGYGFSVLSLAAGGEHFRAPH